MTGTFEALLVLVVAVLPGAVYTIALENRGAGWAWPKSDTTSQIIRFVGASAVFHALFAPVTYWAYRTLIVTHALSAAGRVELYWWPILLGYLIIPYLWGEVSIRARRNWTETSCWLKRFLKWFVSLYTASAPEPRAWDWFFSKNDLKGTIRLQLTTGEWKAGYWGDSYASSYGEDGDLYLGVQYELNEDGSLALDESGDVKPMGAGLLIRWSEIRYLEFGDESD